VGPQHLGLDLVVGIARLGDEVAVGGAHQVMLGDVVAGERAVPAGDAVGDGPALRLEIDVGLADGHGGAPFEGAAWARRPV
jgi:hypothetical protein